jgi:hypothetical protein
MFFAKVRWIGRVLEGAGIDNHSKAGRELTTSLVRFARHFKKMNHRGMGALSKPLDISPAEWALFAAIVAPGINEVVEYLSAALRTSAANATALLARTSNAALKLAQQEKPALLSKLFGNPDEALQGVRDLVRDNEQFVASQAAGSPERTHAHR